MRRMLEGVVLHGTGKKAALNGYTSAGKTGTAQRVDPNTHAYSKTKYIASFAGFAPVNNPTVTVAVILDSPEGLHQGGQVSAPVFARITQQILSYLNVPRDVEIAPSRQLLLASKRSDKATEDDMADGAPDRLGSTLDAAIIEMPDPNPQPDPAPPASHELAKVVPASIRTRELPAAAPVPRNPEPSSSPRRPESGTVVIDVEQGGILVPSFLGKHLRAAVELAEQNNLEIDAVGSGVAKDQSPPPGAHVAAGTRVRVSFER
jgi:cell division protein FtsI (penicillin-binding protein 3)